MPLAEAEARRIVAYRLSVSVLSHASLASTLLRPVPPRLDGRSRLHEVPGLPYPPWLTSTLPSWPSVLLSGLPRYSTLHTYMYLPTCIFYLPDSRSTYSPTHTGHISLPPIHLLPPPQLSAVGRLLLFRRKEGGHHCYRHVPYGTGKVR